MLNAGLMHSICHPRAQPMVSTLPKYLHFLGRLHKPFLLDFCENIIDEDDVMILSGEDMEAQGKKMYLANRKRPGAVLTATCR
jgi:hypothetical protein